MSFLGPINKPGLCIEIDSKSNLEISSSIIPFVFRSKLEELESAPIEVIIDKFLTPPLTAPFAISRQY